MVYYQTIRCNKTLVQKFSVRFNSSCLKNTDTWNDPNRQKSVNISFNKSNKHFSVKLFCIHIFKSSLIFQGRCINLDYLAELPTTQKLKADRVSSLCVIHWVSESENRITLSRFFGFLLSLQANSEILH